MTKNKPKHINFQDENDSDFEADAQPAKQQEEYDQNYLIEQRQKLMGFRKNLPIYSGRSKIIEYIRKNEVTIIVGETGSGKTTQIPQYLFEDKFIQGNRAIAVTQPRKVAAVSLAGRVAQEAGSSVGDLVGYSVRFDNCCSERTRIKYVTDGMLLRESLMDPNFDQYSVIILDEAHERTLRTDVLLGLCKEALQKRKKTKNPLKLVVMSATLQADKFSDFFNNAPILWVEGRTFPVKMMYTVTPYPDYLDACILTVFQIHLTQPLGDILVFLTGQEEIESLEKAIKEYTEKLPPSTTKLVVATLFANLPSHQQQQTLTPLPKGQRKVILSTNIAETSLTIPNVKYIIDPGLAKVRGFDSNVGIESLLVQPISQSGAQQRAGRAGREAAGTCYRLYTEDSFKSMSVEDIPEIQRCNLAFAVLTLKAFGIKDILKFPFMTPPARKGLILALEHLYSLNALDSKGELTQLGRDMSSFPLEPRFAKILLESKKFGCTDPILSILSLLSVDNLFYSNSENREQAQEAKKKFINTTGDHLTYLNLYKSYKSHNGSAAWCKKNYVNKRSMNYVDEIKNQLVSHCERLGIDPKTTTDDSQTILQCLLTGNFMNTALLQPDGTYRSVMGKQKVNIHPMSTIFTKKPEAVMYNELIFTTKHYMRGISVIVPQWIVQSAPHYLGKKSN